MKECPKCGSTVSASHPAIIEYSCGSVSRTNPEGEWLFYWMGPLCPARAELTKLKSDVERLRTSAEPFAKIAKWFGDSLPDTETLVRGTSEYRLTLGHFRALARALEETK